VKDTKREAVSMEIVFWKPSRGHIWAASEPFATRNPMTDKQGRGMAALNQANGSRRPRKRNLVFDPKGYKRYEPKVALAKRRPRPRPPVLRVVSKETS